MKHKDIELYEFDGIGRKWFCLSWIEEKHIKTICFRKKGWAILQFKRKVKEREDK